MSSEALEAHCIHAIGGGWGQETQDDKHTERVAVIRGTDIPRAAFGDISGIPLRWETHSKVKSRLLQAGDIVIEVSGGSAASGQHTGRALLVSSDLLDRLGGRVIPASFCRLLRLDSTKVDPKFICYQIAGMHLTGEISEFENQSTGIANFQFTRFISDVSPALDELGDQREVAAILGALDDRITLLRETNTTLEAIVQALFKSWFVDFDPVHAKMQGRTPEGMDQATAALFPDSFEDSELGPVPKGWGSGCLGEVAKTFKKAIVPTNLHAGVNYVGLEHMPRKSLALTDWGDAAELGSNKAAFNEGDILFGKLRPYFHKVVLAPTAGVCSTDILVCQPTQAEHRGLATMHLFSEALISYADRLSNGAKMPRVNWIDLAKFPITVPSHEVSGAYTVAVEPLLSQIIQNTHIARTLARVRDTLLPRLISGQLRLSEVDANMESA